VEEGLGEEGRGRRSVVVCGTQGGPKRTASVPAH